MAESLSGIVTMVETCGGCSCAFGRPSPHVVGLYRCEGCGGLVGRVRIQAEAFTLVKGAWERGEYREDEVRYFDISWPGDRRHGWYLPRTGNITQIG